MAIRDTIKKIFSSRESKELKKLKLLLKGLSFSSSFDFIDPSIVSELVTIPEQLAFYANIAPVFTAVEYISNEFSCFKPIIKDEKNNVFIEDHPILELLKRPSDEVSRVDFLKNIASFKSITGNVFLLATGNINRPPLELLSIKPQKVEPVNTLDAIVSSYLIEPFGLRFKRTEDKRGVRYLHDEDKELRHIRNFNPEVSPFGMSPLNPIFQEIKQHASSNTHNLSLLENGLRTSGILSPDVPITSEQAAQLTESIRKVQSGARNAGRMMMLPSKMTFLETGTTNKDMDFKDLKSQLAVAIYSALKIPLPLIMSDRMTLANMETAKLMLYDNAVLPLADTLFSELTHFLMPRYKNSENFIITFDEREIDALQVRRNEEIKLLKDIGVLTINELRVKLGEKELQGGDALYLPANIVPTIGGEAETISSDPEDFDELGKNQFIELAGKHAVDKTESQLGAIYDRATKRVA